MGSGYERERWCRAADLDADAAVLAPVERVDWFGSWSELLLRVGGPIVSERIVHRHAKAATLAGEDQRRRRVERAPSE